MIGIDANLLVRLVLRDDAAQLAVVEARLARAIEEREAVSVGPIALAETVWLLRRRRVPRDELSAILRALMDTPPLKLFDEAVVAEALDAFDASRADFADCLTVAMHAAAGCRAMLTFDRAALRVPGFAHPAEA